MKRRYKIFVLLLAIPILLQASIAVAPTAKITSFWDKNTVPNYVDLGNFAWAAESIDTLSKYGIMNGYIEENINYFKANALMSRAEFAKIIVSAFGIYDSSATNSMFDNPTTWWAYPFIASSVKSGLAKGYSSEWFGANDPIMREDASVMIVNAVAYAGMSLPNVNFSKDFADEGNIDLYAKDAVDKLQMEGIVQGDKFNKFYPKSYAERAEIAVMIDRVLQAAHF